MNRGALAAFRDLFFEVVPRTYCERCDCDFPRGWSWLWPGAVGCSGRSASCLALPGPTGFSPHASLGGPDCSSLLGPLAASPTQSAQAFIASAWARPGADASSACSSPVACSGFALLSCLALSCAALP